MVSESKGISRRGALYKTPRRTADLLKIFHRHLEKDRRDLAKFLGINPDQDYSLYADPSQIIRFPKYIMMDSRKELPLNAVRDSGNKTVNIRHIKKDDSAKVILPPWMGHFYQEAGVNVQDLPNFSRHALELFQLFYAITPAAAVELDKRSDFLGTLKEEIREKHPDLWGALQGEDLETQEIHRLDQVMPRVKAPVYNAFHINDFTIIDFFGLKGLCVRAESDEKTILKLMKAYILDPTFEDIAFLVEDATGAEIERPELTPKRLKVLNGILGPGSLPGGLPGYTSLLQFMIINLVQKVTFNGPKCGVFHDRSEKKILNLPLSLLDSGAINIFLVFNKKEG